MQIVRRVGQLRKFKFRINRNIILFDFKNFRGCFFPDFLNTLRRIHCVNIYMFILGKGNFNFFVARKGCGTIVIRNIKGSSNSNSSERQGKEGVAVFLNAVQSVHVKGRILSIKITYFHSLVKGFHGIFAIKGKWKVRILFFQIYAADFFRQKISLIRNFLQLIFYCKKYLGVYASKTNRSRRIF